MAWCDYNYEENSACDQVLWYNSGILIENKPVFWLRPFQKGLLRVSQLFENKRLISVGEAKQKFGLEFLELHALISAIPDRLKELIKNDNAPWRSKYAECLDYKDLSKRVYDNLLSKTSNEKIVRIKNKWEQILNIALSMQDFCKIVRNIFVVTNIAKYRSFQYRLLMRGLVSGQDLYKWGIINTALCYFCNIEKESIPHIMFECSETKEVWSEAKKIIQDRTGYCCTLNVRKILMNEVHPTPRHLANFVCLVVKQYIYKQKCLKCPLQARELHGRIISLENTEKYIAIKNNKLAKHMAKWYPGTGQE